MANTGVEIADTLDEQLHFWGGLTVSFYTMTDSVYHLLCRPEKSLPNVTKNQ